MAVAAKPAPIAKATTTEIPVNRLIIDPTRNYRWSSKAAMEADLKAERPGEDGELVNGFEVLKASIKRLGVTVPIGVRPVGEKFEVIYGFQRALIATELRLGKIKANVYPAALREDQRQCLQYIENAGIKQRSVSWVRDLAMFNVYFDAVARRHLIAAGAPEDETNALTDIYERSLPDSVRKGVWAKSKRRPGPFLDDALREVCEHVGRPFGEMREHRRLMYHIRTHFPEVAELCDLEVLSYPMAKEFYSGDMNNPYDANLVREIVADLRRNYPNFKAKPGQRPQWGLSAVQKTKWRVQKLLALPATKGDTRPLWLRSYDASTGAAERDCSTEAHANRPSPASLRDLATNLADALVETCKITVDSPAAAWEKLRQTQTWFKCVGLAIGSGDVVLNDDAFKACGRVTTSHVLADNYVIAAIVTAVARRQVMAKLNLDVDGFDSWLLGYAKIDGRLILNRITFYGAIAKALPMARNIKDAVDSAWRTLAPDVHKVEPKKGEA